MVKKSKCTSHAQPITMELTMVRYQQTTKHGFVTLK